MKMKGFALAIVEQSIDSKNSIDNKLYMYRIKEYEKFGRINEMEKEYLAMKRYFGDKKAAMKGNRFYLKDFGSFNWKAINEEDFNKKLEEWKSA